MFHEGIHSRDLDELQSARGLVEVQVERSRDGHSCQGRGQRDQAREPVAANEQNQNRSRQRQERCGGQDRVVSHRASIARARSTTIPIAMISP